MATCRKYFTFAFFGGLSGVVYALVLMACVDHLKMQPLLGSIIAFSIAIPVSYFGHRLLTYRSRNVMPAEAARFVVAQIVNLVITSVVVHVTMKAFHLPTYGGGVVGIATAPLVSFVLFEQWVYRQRRDTPVLDRYVTRRDPRP
ncbi:Putative flippase GtrA (transmembrane translocase of bactoprenol-linked glucose) [Rhizobiales bacterium GAS191]|nr:Putative flippase GtrA (transmembrane translocase of bactoprenol-linked glucose) [Rhizobiales bacterium GAS191]